MAREVSSGLLLAADVMVARTVGACFGFWIAFEQAVPNLILLGFMGD
jgi:hypothetical protein